MILKDKAALVTGGARGIGADICRALAREGAAVAINYATSGEKAESLASEIKENGGKAIAVQADVRDPTAVEAMIKEAVGEFGRLDGLINNAIGGQQNGMLDQITLDNYQNMFDYGCVAVVNTIKAVRPVMQGQGGGRIVNIVTELWNMGSGDWLVYLAGKGAMVGLSRARGERAAADNITLNMVAPGWMADEKVDTSSQGSLNFGKTLPLRRHGSALEIGNACVFYLSHLAGYVTGTYLPGLRRPYHADGLVTPSGLHYGRDHPTSGTLGGCPGIARVHGNLRRTSYRGIVPDAHLAGLSYERREEQTRALCKPMTIALVL